MAKDQGKRDSDDGKSGTGTMSDASTSKVIAKGKKKSQDAEAGNVDAEAAEMAENTKIVDQMVHNEHKELDEDEMSCYSSDS